MGCSAAKNLTVEPLNGNDLSSQEPRKISITRRASQVPPLEGDEPQTEVLDGGTVNNVQKTYKNWAQKYIPANGLSFDIAFAEERPESIIRKHPPRRFQRLEEQETSTPNLSLARLQEKLDEAEIRRQQILQQRVASAKVRNALKRQHAQVNGDSQEIEDDLNHLKVPPDINDVSYL